MGPDPEKLLASAVEDVDSVRHIVTTALIQGIKRNNRSIMLRVRYYRIGAGALLAETVVLLIALLISYSGRR
jgi:hypothetical protein